MENNIENEVWRDVDGYDGMYQVSDLGRVRSLKYGKVRVMKPQKDKGGYLSVHFYKDSIEKSFLVHRLVAQAFIPNDDENKTQINHRNEDKTENKVSNLEWCSAQYNMTYNGIHRRRKHTKYKRNAIKDLYNPELSIDDNIELFKSKGIECSDRTIKQLRKDLGLTKQYELKQVKIKDIYRPDLSINENLKMFKEQGIECCKETVVHLRKELGLTRKYTKRS